MHALKRNILFHLQTLANLNNSPDIMGSKACKTPLKLPTVKLLWHIWIYENTEIPGEK